MTEGLNDVTPRKPKKGLIAFLVLVALSFYFSSMFVFGVFD
jgi:hypothetical protein